jgi:hypothetical protein
MGFSLVVVTTSVVHEQATQGASTKKLYQKEIKIQSLNFEDDREQEH